MALVTRSARGEVARIVVIDADPRVAEAIDLALSPWSLAVVRAPGPLPEPDIVTALARAHAIAGEEHAGAVIWIEPASRGSRPSLWVYDAETQQLAVRPLGASAPFDAAGAAAVALSVKTILRGSALDVSAKPAPAPAPQSPPPPPHAAAVTQMAERTAKAPTARAREPIWRMETDVDAMTPTGTAAVLQMRIGLGASVWPRIGGPHVGVGVNVRGGPAVIVDVPVFHGSLAQTSFEATARLRTTVIPWLAFELQTGPSLLLVTLDGETRPIAKPAHSLRLNPAWDAFGLLDFNLSPRLSVGVSAGASTVFRAQRYTVDNVFQVTVEPRVVGLFGVRICAGID